MEWKPSPSKYENGEYGMLGKWKIFSLLWDTSTGSQSEKNYVLTSFLPGIQKNLGHESLKEGKTLAKKILAFWLEKSGI